MGSSPDSDSVYPDGLGQITSLVFPKQSPPGSGHRKVVTDASLSLLVELRSSDYKTPVVWAL